MKREVWTIELDDDQIRAELGNFVAYFKSRGHETCNVLFGWAWGVKYYPEKVWPTEDIPLSELEAKVQAVEASGIGELGSDDLWLVIEQLEFQFCHHGDIHIKFEAPNVVVTDFEERWKSLGFEPKERAVEKSTFVWRNKPRED